MLLADNERACGAALLPARWQRSSGCEKCLEAFLVGYTQTTAGTYASPTAQRPVLPPALLHHQKQPEDKLDRQDGSKNQLSARGFLPRHTTAVNMGQRLAKSNIWMELTPAEVC